MNGPRACFLCPGRGSYGREELGFLARTLRPGPVAELLDEVDRHRAREGAIPLRELDAADTFRPGLHLAAENAAELIFFCTLAHAECLAERYTPSVVVGNSMGWYTALAVAGALEPRAAWRLVATMARLQSDVRGGQLLTTTVDDEWRRVPARAAAVARALEEASAVDPQRCFVAYSIHLGGHEVLAGTPDGLDELERRLPRVRVGRRELPMRLAGHGPFHTPLCAGVAARARHALGDLPVRRPATWLVDGRGRQHGPWSSDPAELVDYTLTTQVVATFDFTGALRVALREHQPDAVVCLGPGDSLRAPAGHVIVEEGHRGLRDRRAVIESGIVRRD